MKNLVLFLIVFVSLNSNGQVWGRSGATWHYEITGLSLFDGISIVRYEGDTIIDMYPAQKYSRSIQYIYPDPNGPIQGPINPVIEFTRYSGDSVFWYKDNQFYLLFDFGAQVGDSWIIHNSSGSATLCDSLSRLNVVGIGTETINGHSLRYIDVEAEPGSGYGYFGRIHERMGSISGGAFGYFWPTNIECDTNMVAEYMEWDFNCYSDDSFGEYSQTSGACNPYQFVSSNELNLEERKVVKMFDLLGRELIEPTDQLVIVHYSDGSIAKEIRTKK